MSTFLTRIQLETLAACAEFNYHEVPVPHVRADIAATLIEAGLLERVRAAPNMVRHLHFYVPTEAGEAVLEANGYGPDGSLIPEEPT